MQENHQHSLLIEQRKSITVSGVESVSSFSEVKIVLKLLDGSRLSILGVGLKITGFSKTSGEFTAEGEFMGLSYGGKSLAAKIFK